MLTSERIKKPGFIRASSLSTWQLLEQRVARQAVFLEDLAQTLEGLNLDLPNSLAGQADFLANLLQGAAFMAAQAKATNHHLALLIGQLRQPLIDALAEIVVLQ